MIGRGTYTPKRAGQQLRTALARTAINPDAKTPVPLEYALDALAQRWGVAPWELEEAPGEWVLRGLEFMRIESSVTTRKAGKRG